MLTQQPRHTASGVTKACGDAEHLSVAMEMNF